MIDIPPLRTSWFLRGGHRQTLAGFFFPGTSEGRSGRRHTLTLPDGDVLILHDDCPATWRPCAPVVLLLHGLSGSHTSAYLVRIAKKLNAIGVRTFRLDHRGCGAGHLKARRPYHAGRSDDVFEAVWHIHQECKGSLIGCAGFSLSGNMLLKLLGEAGHRELLPRELACAVAVNPPIDLHRCAAALDLPLNRFYERHFIKELCQQVAERVAHFEDAPRPKYSQQPDRLREFDDAYTAPVSGFDGVTDYYDRCSGAQFVPAIQTPTLVLTSRDDPLVPVASFEDLHLPPSVKLHIAPTGGHLGYLSRRGSDPDCRWMDWRVIEWLTALLRA